MSNPRGPNGSGNIIISLVVTLAMLYLTNPQAKETMDKLAKKAKEGLDEAMGEAKKAVGEAQSKTPAATNTGDKANKGADNNADAGKDFDFSHLKAQGSEKPTDDGDKAASKEKPQGKPKRATPAKKDAGNDLDI